MRTIFVLIVLSALACLTTGEGPSADLSLLSAKFQSMINELGDKTVHSDQYKDELASILQKLQHLQSPPSENRTISLEWFGVSGTQTQASPLRIVLVVSSFEGMYLNSGIGTFYSALADFLVGHGHTVTILYTNTDNSDAADMLFDRWQSKSQKRGISVVKLDPLPVHVTAPILTQQSYQVYQYMKKHQQEFDVVHFPDFEGSGYFTMLVKHQGIEFLSKVFVVGLHGPTRWVKFANQDPLLTDAVEVETDYLEKRSVEMADILVTPSSDLPQWLVQQGWDLPRSDNIYLMPFLPGKEVTMINKKEHQTSEGNQNVKELVFFGRLEARKGVVLFADALDMLAQRTESAVRQLKVTFLGRSSDIEGQSASKYLNKRAEAGAWPFTLSFLSHKDRRGSLEYLLEKGQDRVAVMPSLVDNAPYTVYECLYTRIPFLATNLPSISTLVSASDRESALFAPSAHAISVKLAEVVLGGAPIVRSSLQIDTPVKSWESLYHVLDTKSHTPSPTQAPHTLPKVSICIPYYNRPHLLPLTLQSVYDQDYPADKIEVVLVDDGSTDAAAIKYIDDLQADFHTRGWKIVRTENRYLGAARNTAARTATGEYLLFLDDDNLAKPNQVSTYVSVATYTHAEIITAAHDVFRGEGLPDESAHNTNVVTRSVALGASATVGIFKNCFGDANFFVRRESFLESGGFTEEKGVGQEDYEYFAKSVLAGRKMEAIPEVLLYYRMHENPSNQMLYNTNPASNQVRSARQYASLLDEDVETGDVLKVLAHRRVETMARVARGELSCNITRISADKVDIPASLNQSTFVTFTSSYIGTECQIKSVFIGTFLCSRLVQNGTSSFTCFVPPIPFPGKFKLSILFEGTETLKRTTFFINVTQGVLPTNIAVLVANFTANSTYPIQALFNAFAKLLGRSPSIFSIIDEIIKEASQKRAAAIANPNHILRFTLATPVNESALSVAVRLISVVLRNKNVFSRAGVDIQDFIFQGDCDVSSKCTCAPNFAGDDCSSKPECLNSCSNNGDCVDGLFGRVCNCYLGSAGRDCSFNTCPLECSGRGACRIGQTQNGKCDCFPGYNGTGCEIITSPCPGNCNGFGTCVQGKCVCKPGRKGEGCLDKYAAGQVSETQSTIDNTVDDGSITKGLIAAIVIVSAMIVIVVAMAVYLVFLRRR